MGLGRRISWTISVAWQFLLCGIMVSWRLLRRARSRCFWSSSCYVMKTWFRQFELLKMGFKSDLFFDSSFLTCWVSNFLFFLGHNGGFFALDFDTPWICLVCIKIWTSKIWLKFSAPIQISVPWLWGVLTWLQEWFFDLLDTVDIGICILNRRWGKTAALVLVCLISIRYLPVWRKDKVDGGHIYFSSSFSSCVNSGLS